jgi:hypothetical protein
MSETKRESKMYRCVWFLLPLLFAGGCLCDPQYCRYPDLFYPGYDSEQQEWARKFDPFTSSDMGPSIVRDRPSGALDPTPSQQRYSRSGAAK